MTIPKHPVCPSKPLENITYGETAYTRNKIDTQEGTISDYKNGLPTPTIIYSFIMAFWVSFSQLAAEQQNYPTMTPDLNRSSVTPPAYLGEWYR